MGDRYWWQWLLSPWQCHLELNGLWSGRYQMYHKIKQIIAEERRIILASRPRRSCNWKYQSHVLYQRSGLSPALCIKSGICFVHLPADLRLPLSTGINKTFSQAQAGTALGCGISMSWGPADWGKQETQPGLKEHRLGVEERQNQKSFARIEMCSLGTSWHFNIWW